MSALLLPDPYQPLLHLVAEGPKRAEAERLAGEYEAKVLAWIEA
jgi:hypothetical protein